MGDFWNSMVQSHLRTQQLFGLLIVLALVLGLAYALNRSGDELLTTDQLQAQVLMLERHSSGEFDTKYGSSNIQIHRARSRLHDGTEMTLPVHHPLPVRGETIRVSQEQYQSGKTLYFIPRVP